MKFKPIKELDEMQPNPPWIGYREALTQVQEIINKRLGELREMRKRYYEELEYGADISINIDEVVVCISELELLNYKIQGD